MMGVFTRNALLCTRRAMVYQPVPYQPLLKRHYAVPKSTHLRYQQKDSPPEEIEPPTPLKTHHTHLSQLSSNLKYPLKHANTQFQPEDYTKPLGQTEKLPFFFHRTPSNRLPIYSDFKNQGIKKSFTIVRKFDGDIKELSKEIARLIPDAVIEEKAASLIVKGDHVQLLRYWLMQLGF